MLRKKEPFELDTAREQVKKYLSGLLSFSDSEKEFMSLFQNSQYQPNLIFSGEMLERVVDHPMAAWKMAVSDRQAQTEK
jgi:hypothetical protein